MPSTSTNLALAIETFAIKESFAMMQARKRSSIIRKQMKGQFID